MHRLFFIALVLIPSLATAAPNESIGVRQSPQVAPLQAMAAHLIDMRAQSLGVYAPLPPTNAMTPDVVSSKLAALSDALAYTNQVLDGLSASASTPAAQQQLVDQFRPVRERFERYAADVLIQILTSPAVADHGWVTTSAFGDETERQAVDLLPTLRNERPFLAALQTTVDRLVSKDLASVDAQLAIAVLLEQPLIARDQLGLSPEKSSSSH
jgi:hypothetical protein